MSRITILLLSFCLFQIAAAQSTLSRVTFPIDEQQSRSDLAKAGIDLTHGHGSTRDAFTTEVEDFHLARFDAMGIRYYVVIPDMSVHRKEMQQQHRGNNFLDCQDHTFDEIIPRNFEFGSLGGFFSQPELLDHLDAMAIAYPNLISIRKPIGNFKTWHNNNVYYIKISDNPNVDENEPQILYTGLHHAREFISVSQMIYYMWYLLENYDKDPLIKQIIDHTELYFVPVVNPDGLNYNAAGYNAAEDIFTRNHRKNMRDNDGDGTFDPKNDGVDLNRNYGHAWGYNEEGSSGYPGSDTYRGIAPFSEPETQAIAHLCNTHEFKIALNHHSYGNLLIYPWGYNDQATQDSILFSNYGELLTQLNRFVYGLGIETVGYSTNGDADDWMYAEHNTYAMTPEVGDSEDGFYPVRERIIPLCQSALELNLLAARLVNSLIDITDESPKFIEPGVNPFDLAFNRYGLLDGEVTISFNALSPYVLSVPSPIHIDLQKFQPHERNLSLTVAQQIPYGTPVRIEITCQQGEYIFRDTLTKIRADFHAVISDEGDIALWNTQDGPNWNTTTEAYKSGPVSITDSPFGPYAKDAHEVILLDQQIDLNQTTSVYAQFWAQWDLEDFFDYVVFQASTDGETWGNLCGEHSRLGSLFQLYNEPLYDGKQNHWVLENIDLSAYLGQIIQLRFLLVSDGYVHKDGFYFDNFKVIKISEEPVATSDPVFSGIAVFPNPAGNFFTVSLPEMVNPSIAVYNSIGRMVYAISRIQGQTEQIITSSWPAGLYHYQVLTDGMPVHGGTLSLIKTQ